MVVFYPEFESPMDSCVEFIILVDLSNSMGGEPARTAKTNALLLLSLLLEAEVTVLFNVVVFGTGNLDLLAQFYIRIKRICLCREQGAICGF